MYIYRWPPFISFSGEVLWNWWMKFNETRRKVRSQYPLPLFFADRSENQDGRSAFYWVRHFDFASETATRNSTKLDRKEDLNVLNQVCVFRQIGKTKMVNLVSDWLRYFRRLWNHWTEFNETCQETRSQHFLQSLFFSGPSEKQDNHPASIWLRNFRLLLWNRWTRNSTKAVDRKQDLNVLYQVCVFRAERKTEIQQIKDDTLYSGVR